MENQVTNYKCPACGGPLHFDSDTGRMLCDYCDSVFAVEQIEELYAQTDPENSDGSSNEYHEPADNWQINSDSHFDETDGLKAFNCPSCGAQLLLHDTTAATSCPYCDNPTIVPSSISGVLKPDLIIPFKLDKEAAKDALRAHFKGKKLLPKLFTSENHLDEIKGIYVPFWLFDADARAEASFSATQVRTWSDHSYNYTETRFFELDRCGSVMFDNIPVDGSKEMADELMESLEPFDMDEAVPFQSAYLTGYYADRYDVSDDESIKRANERVRESSFDMLRSTTQGFLGVTQKTGRVHIKNGKAKYALLPVWILNTTWHGNKYVFAMNGQTGKFVGDLPVDSASAWVKRLGYGFGIAAALTIIELLTMSV
ncbi:MAG: TFIIB-type zinc ribbon-containing protein [Eubacteriales bacterium]|nr:TFIIB-type zinc ribbon-containing protein [Eubacteriales bacterium]